MKKLFGVIFLLFLALHVSAEPTFPKLTSRVVDGANILSSTTKKSLQNMLEKLEKKSSNQLVVVTLKSLEGYDIADFAYRLGRHWGIGQKKKNNGVLFIIAPKERKARIDVGYGLEGVLSDALCSVILQDRVVPYFKRGDFNKGVLEGAKAIIGAIQGTYKPQKSKTKKINPLIPQLFFALFFLMVILQNRTPQKLRNIISKAIPSSFFGLFAYMFSTSVLIGLGVWIGLFFLFLYFNAFSTNHTDSLSSGGFYTSSSGFDSDFDSGFGGFSGGGGSFGGGGASGSW